ncbi:hypothetical protein [Streptococcus pantholopis]|uniref:Uncharacterized protein n=1 Tax=Streptococcus pantholopis TaxID=1811193 RepID=A0A172Q9R8_9STRE|nr:hypothetical protein [Streptococcus pantholopis]AND80204.1 hypothetical protein A0O21_09450 [Streptococcus pantholopis]
MDKWTNTGFSLVVIGILVLVWGGTLQPINILSPDFMSFATGGLILFATGLCLISNLPFFCQIAGLWLAAVTVMLYIYSLPDTDLIVKVIGFVPVLALAVWLTIKFWK